MADSDRPLYKILTTKTIWWASGLILAVAAAVTTWLLLAFGYQLEAIKTASTIVLGTGGAAALLLAARRQRSTELALNQKDRDLAHQERDAIERRITDLYTKAADQLGSDKAPVRLAGLYALERLAQNNPNQRQTIVNLFCAYLRMPYEPPGDKTDPTQVDRLQEREVRLTAQRLLAFHLRPGDGRFWEGITLDLTGATLIEFNLAHCTLHAASFRSATFVGNADFESTTFAGEVDFVRAKFTRRATFDAATFTGRAVFSMASFGGSVGFSSAHFVEAAHFLMVTFDGYANFYGATFDGEATFDKLVLLEDGEPTTFNGEAHFERATFGDSASFEWAIFKQGAHFEGAAFNDLVSFGDAEFVGPANFKSVSFKGRALFEGATFAEGMPDEARQAD
jgi:uncharacterized protein YjbI with pentapeptide repeats